MKTQIKQIMTLAGIVLMIGCSGSGTTSTSSTGDTSVLSGSVESSGTSALVKSTTASSTNCKADTVIATNTLAESTSTTVGDDCSFTLNLQANHSYAISFTLAGEFVASLIFDAGHSGYSMSSIPANASSINLGTISITGNTASPGLNPLSQIDSDDDGTYDYDDSDDDNDGIDDSQEDDCDFDGFNDDEDDDDASCDTGNQNQERARAYEVKPHNDPHPELGMDRVDLEQKVKARFSCRINTNSVNAQTFRVQAENHEINCDYELSSDNTRIECRHDHDPFDADTTYEVTIDGITCQNNDAPEAMQWQFRTEVSDDDQGNAEDELDDSIEQDDQSSSSDDTNTEDSSSDDSNSDSDEDSQDSNS